MKKTLILLSLAVLVLMTACSPESKAKRSIETYLKTNLNDPGSYEFVKMGELQIRTLADWKQIQAKLVLINEGYDVSDPLPTDAKFRDTLHKYAATPEYNRLSEKGKDEAVHRLSQEVQRVYHAEEDKAYAGLAASRDADMKVVNLYTVDFTYRAKNKLGALGLETTTFKLDSAFNVVGASLKD